MNVMGTQRSCACLCGLYEDYVLVGKLMELACLACFSMPLGFPYCSDPLKPILGLHSMVEHARVNATVSKTRLTDRQSIVVIFHKADTGIDTLSNRVVTYNFGSI